MAQSDVLTGQYVRIRQTAASVGDRILAQFVDWGVLLSYTFLSVWLGVELFSNSGFWYFVFFVFFPIIFYTLLCEIFNHGQSIGKMATKTRVVKLDGSTPSLGAFVMRWLLYIIDGPATSYMGLVVMMLTKNHQRLGDLAAGTVVIKLQDYKKIQVSLDDYDYLMKNYTPRYAQAADLSLEQIEIISRTVGTPRADFTPRVTQLSQKIQQKFGIRRAEPTDAAFLQRLLRDYQYYALEEI